VAVICDTEQEIRDCLMCLKGQLTCSIFTNELKRRVVADMIRMFEERAGRLIFNGVPTGVTVCPSMTHGGPFPATTDVRFTAVGIDAIRRFLRPITYQNFPDEHLPPALRDANTLGIRRRINGQFSVDNL
jgi:alpha-ketoglutaric semialdehyde dehydrogenase